jgi:hypothetical protein
MSDWATQSRESEILLAVTGILIPTIVFLLQARKRYLRGERVDQVPVPAIQRGGAVKIKNVQGITSGEIDFEVQRGGKFVAYQYCISILVHTYRRSSRIYFLRSGESARIKGLPFTLLTFAAGWWSFPFGPAWTLQSLVINLRGGTDLTKEVLASFNSGASGTPVRNRLNST